MLKKFQIKRNLDIHIVLAYKWQTKSNFKKCKVMHKGENNENFSFGMKDHWLDALKDEKVL